MGDRLSSTGNEPRIDDLAVSHWDLVRGIVHRDPAWLRLTGHGEQDAIDDVEFWTARVAVADLARFFVEFGRLNAPGCDSTQFGYRFRCADGRYRRLACRLTVERRDAHGAVLQFRTEEFAIDDFLSPDDELRPAPLVPIEARAGVWLWQPTIDRIWWSEELSQRFGIDASGSTCDALGFVERFDGDSRERILTAMQRTAQEGIGFVLAVQLAEQHGFRIPVRIAGDAQREPDGRISQVLGSLAFAVARSAEDELAGLRRAVGFDRRAMIEFDLVAGRIRLSPQAGHSFGLVEGEEPVTPERLAGFLTATSRREGVPWLDGMMQRFDLDATPIVVSDFRGRRLRLAPHMHVETDAGRIGFVRIEDIDDLEGGTERYLDPLTGLHRFAVFERLADAALGRNQGPRRALLILNVDRLRVVNGLFGDGEGDRLLRSIGQRLRTLFPTALMCRRSSDTFLVFFECRSDLPSERLAEAALADLHAIKLPAARLFNVSLSAGLVESWPEVALEELVRAAETALQHARREGGHRLRVYDMAMGIEAARERMMRGRLPGAIARDELTLAFQPVVSCVDGRCLGAECLLRWTPTGLGPVPPGEFIPVAEESGDIHALGRWALAEAIAALTATRAAGIRLERLSVNVSVKQLADRELPAWLAGICAARGLSTSELVIEITESTLLQDAPEIIETLAAFRDLGFVFAIDDFGTGYSNLETLSRIEVAHIKIDRSLVERIRTDPRSLGMAKMVVALARTLDCATVAEGVEKVSDAALLREIGCDAIQGFVYAKPMTLDVFVQWLERRMLATAGSASDSRSTAGARP